MNEDGIHQAIVIMCRWRLRKGAIMHHSPREALRGAKGIDLALSHSLQLGFPTLQFLWRGNSWFLDVKGKTGEITTAQRETMSQLRGQGFKGAFTRSLPDATKVLEHWGLLKMNGRKGRGFDNE